MDFSLTDDQRAIADLARRIFSEQVSDASLAALDGATDDALWKTLADAGLIGVAMTERKQFGKPIAGFQAVSHRAADGYIDTRALRAVIDGAMWQLQESRDATLEAGAALWWAAEAGHRIGHTGQHLHGGIGSDLKYPIHRFYLRTKQLEFSLGGAAHQLAHMGQYLRDNNNAGTKL